MKRKVGSAVALIGLVAAVVATALFRSSASGVAAPSYAFAMCVSRGAHSASAAWSEPLLASVARTLSPGERASLEEALAVSATRWEARANPMLEDIESVDPDTSLAAWFEKAPSFVRTAQAAARPVACAPDGFCARPRHGETCPGGWSVPASDADAARARFIVWPWGHALRLRARSEIEARSASGLLREHARSSKRIALVMGSDDNAVTQAEPFVRLRELWKRYGLFRKMARAERLEPEADRLWAIDEREIVVLPRLGTLDDDAAFEAEVRAAAPNLANVAR